MDFLRLQEESASPALKVRKEKTTEKEENKEVVKEKEEKYCPRAYRSPRVFGDKFGETFGDKFGDSLNFVINMVTILVTHFVRHQICHNFW